MSTIDLAARANIRATTTEDAANLATLMMQVWLDTYATEGVRQELADYVWAHLTPAALERDMREPERQWYVAEHLGHLVGLAQLHEARQCPTVSEASIEVERLYVSRRFIGRGYGTALLDRVGVHARAVNAPAMWLSVWEHNLDAIRFYQEYGFTECGESWFTLAEELHRNVLFVYRW